MKSFEQAVKQTKRVDTLRKQNPIDKAVEIAGQEMEELSEFDFFNKSALNEFVFCSMYGWAHSSLFTPEGFTFEDTTAKPDGWMKKTKNTYKEVEIKTTIKNKKYLAIRKSNTKYGKKGQLLCSNKDGLIEFKLIYNSIADIKKATENANKYTVAVVWDNALHPKFSYVVKTKDILEQGLKHYHTAKEKAGGDENYKFTRNGSAIIVYAHPKDITYYDKSYKKLFMDNLTFVS